MENNKQKQFIDVTEPPFNARGDGETDDASAFQRAVDFAQAHFKSPRIERSPAASDDQRACPG